MSRKRLSVCWGDSLKCLLKEMMRNYMALVDYKRDFFWI